MSVYVYSNFISTRIGDGAGTGLVHDERVHMNYEKALCFCTAVDAPTPGPDYAAFALQWAPLLVYLLLEARHVLRVARVR